MQLFIDLSLRTYKFFQSRLNLNPTRKVIGTTHVGLWSVRFGTVVWEKCGSDFFLIFVVLAGLIFHEILHGRLPLVGGGNDGMGPSTGHPEPMRTG